MRKHLALLAAAAAGLALFLDAGAAQRATAPGKNGKVAYTAYPDVWLSNLDGSGKVNVTKGLQPVRSKDPAFSPDGDWIVFASEAEKPGIWIVRTNGTGGKKLTSDTTDSEPTWNRDGTRIAFTRRVADRRRLLVMNASGTGVANLTPGLNADVQAPEWAPDGTRIAFSDSAQIYTVNADGSGLGTIANPSGGYGFTRVTWSPDGKRIAIGQIGGIWVANADGSGLAQLTNQVKEVWELAWSPDGRQIVFVQDVGSDPQEELYVVNADGSGLRRLGIDSDTTVAWQPVVGVCQKMGVVRGTEGNDTLRGTAGNDVICGGGGNDTIRGGAGNDTIYGDAGNDTLLGEAGNDILQGGAGDDALTGGPGLDRLFGGAGNDRLDAKDGAKDVVDGGPGTDSARTDRGVDAPKAVEKTAP